MAAARGVSVTKTQFFRDNARGLEGRVTGVKAAIDQFVNAVRAGGGTLAARPVGDGSVVHGVDNPSRGGAGRGQFRVRFTRKVGAHGAVSIILEDIWLHEDGLTTPEGYE
jgi:hypothetical protein